MDITKYFNCTLNCKKLENYDGAGKPNFTNYDIKGRVINKLSLEENNISVLKGATGKVYTNNAVNINDLIEINNEYVSLKFIDKGIDINGNLVFNILYY